MGILIMTSAINSPIKFNASWNSQNKHLKDTISNSVSRVCLAVAQLAAKISILPATILFKPQRIAQINANFDLRWSATEDRGLKNHFTPTPIEVTTPDGVKLYGTFYQNRAAQRNAPTVILCQPNAMLAKSGGFDWLLQQAVIQWAPYNFVSFDYRGCGSKESWPRSMKDLYLDGDSMYQFVKDKLGVMPNNIHWYGYSLGGGVSAAVKKNHLECTGRYVNDRSFSSLSNVVREMTSPIPLGCIIANVVHAILSVLNWNCDSAIAFEKIKGKTLIVHHPKDEMMKGKADLYHTLFKKGIVSPDVSHMDLGQSPARSTFYHGAPIEHFATPGFDPELEISRFLFQPTVAATA